jgi:hypothetical protein
VSATYRNWRRVGGVYRAIAGVPANGRDMMPPMSELTSEIRKELAGGGAVGMEELVDKY